MVKFSAAATVAEYVDRIHEIHRHGRGTPELSYRTALENLLARIGQSLEPAVICTAELTDTGAGRPDFGLHEARSGNSRGVVEVKGPDNDVPHTADGAQVAKYWRHYGVVLVTNYRDFLLITKGQDKRPKVEGRFSFTADAGSFFRSSAKSLSEQKSEELVDFLIGVMRREAPISRPRDLAADLARHAREAYRRLIYQNPEALEPLQRAMEQSLGLHFHGKDGQHFFRSSLVQTLFYGLFSGWMLWRQLPHTSGAFDWKDATEFLALPLIGDLYEEIARPRRLADLRLREPLEWATASLNNVSEAEFFKTFDSDHAITLFYEPFLQAFDPELRKELGVWYTPPEIVKYLIGRVDQLLRTELGIADGLADESVFVLDPAAGTGSYVVEVARKIYETLTEQGHGSLAANKVKKALTTRVFGFEILPAPYVVAHLQMGVLLRSFGTRLADDQRAGVFLTNALTGWEPPTGAKKTLAFPFLQAEQDAASKVKREAPILVVLGNPPYNGFANVAQDEEKDMLKPYSEGLEEYGVQSRGLNELYVRFFRLAERRITEVGSRGIVSFISNYSWLDGQSHPVMRERMLNGFDRIWIDNCNGDKFKTGKRTPDGRSDQSMFTTDSQPVGIQVGVAIATLVRTGTFRSSAFAAACYRDLWGTANDKRAVLLQSNSNPRADAYNELSPSSATRFTLLPGVKSDSYIKWPSIAELSRRQFSGIKTARDEFLIAVDKMTLERRMKAYFDPSISDIEMAEISPLSVADASRFVAREIRSTLQRRGYLPSQLVRVAYRPFDNRWLYWELGAKLLDERRVDFAPHVIEDNFYLYSSNEREKLAGFDRAFLSSHVGELHLLRPDANPIPMLVRQDTPAGPRIEPNVDPEILVRLCKIDGSEAYLTDGHIYAPIAFERGKAFFFHMLAILSSPAYRADNDAALRQDWPRIPLPADLAVFEASASLGRELADLMLPDKPVRGVTTGTIRPELRMLANPTKVGGGSIDEPADTKVEAMWGFRGQKNAVMCGKGRKTANADHDDAVDLWINDRVGWTNVPNDVYAMTIGGYPVVKKWLSYREFKVLGRALTTDELQYVTEMIRRLKAVLLLGPALDENYRRSAAAIPIEFPAGASVPPSA